MEHPSLVATGSESHVEAFRCTGTSPGRAGRIPVSFPAEHGGSVQATVAFEVHGPAHAPAVAVLGGISAGRHLLPTAVDPTPGWWPGVVRAGGALDPDRHRLIGIDFLASAEPDEAGAPPLPVGLHALAVAPPTTLPISTADQARALARVLDAIGAPDVTLVGASYGGMVALAFAALEPGRTRRVVALCAAHRPHPMATALRAVQRRVVRFAKDVRRPTAGVALARALAMATYRSADEFEERFGGHAVLHDGRARFPVEDYLDARGADFARRFDAERFLRLSESIDLHDVEPSEVRAPTTLVSFDADMLVPPWLVDEAARRAGGPARHVPLRSRFGHDAFLKEPAAVSAVVAEALGAREVTR
jgi:homoserine O-acetyltransferase/O-succinyltransferase